MAQSETECPWCHHHVTEHAGGTCYACGFDMTCGHSWINRSDFRGWWNWRNGTPPGMRYLTVSLDHDEKVAAIAEAERILRGAES